MHIIIIGCGKVGSKFARVLSSEGHDVVIIDNDRENFVMLGHDFNGITISGHPIDQDVLKQAGIEVADAFAAVTPDDNVNIMACQVAKEIFKVKRVIARIYNPEREYVFHHFGLETICPTNITVDVIRAIILEDACVTNHTIGGVCVSFNYENVKKIDVGKRLGTLRYPANRFLFGILRTGRKIEFANPNIKLEKDDLLIFAEKKD